MKNTLTPVILMVSGGSDSTALLELAALAARDVAPQGAAGAKLAKLFADAIGDSRALRLKCLHVNHLLRGEDSDGDERFVAELCAQLGIACQVECIDIAAAAQETGIGMEATARQERYRLAQLALESWCAECGVAPEDGLVMTAHTLDDRVETFLMRSLVGTGPGGLGSIPRRRGQIVRPLLDATRQELRDFLAEQHPGRPACELWREDATNDDGSNFRSRVRTQLVPVMRQLKPGFEYSLVRTMDLIAEEDAAQLSAAEGIVYRNLSWDSEEASIPLDALKGLDRPMMRRVLRQCLLVVNPDARLESRQIERVVDAVAAGTTLSTEVDSGIRVSVQSEYMRAKQNRKVTD